MLQQVRHLHRLPAPLARRLPPARAARAPDILEQLAVELHADAHRAAHGALALERCEGRKDGAVWGRSCGFRLTRSQEGGEGREGRGVCARCFSFGVLWVLVWAGALRMC